MRNLKYTLLVLILLCLSNACVEQIELDVNKQSDQLVVDGLITDKPGPNTILLTRTAAFSRTADGVNVPVRNAIVTIKDNNGQTIVLTELSPGRYITPASFKGQVGRIYTLFITTQDKKEFQSKPELLKPVSDIDSIYSEYNDGENGKPEGFNIFIDTKDPANTEDYYQWRWKSYVPITYCDFPRACCTPCWDSVKCIDCINIATDALRQGKNISKQFIRTVPYTSRGLYYILIEQSSLTQDAYRYWKQLSQQSQNVGGTFDAPTAPIPGNVFNKNDPNEEVLGFFGASAVKFKYRFIRRDYIKKVPKGSSGTEPPQLPPGPPPPCKPCEESVSRTAIRPPGF